MPLSPARFSIREVDHFFQTSRRAFFPEFGLHWKTSDLVNSHFSVVVPRGVAASAVARNRIKRRVRTIVRDWLHTHSLSHSYFVVVLARSSILHLEFSEMQDAISQALSQKLK